MVEESASPTSPWNRAKVILKEGGRWNPIRSAGTADEIAHAFAKRMQQYKEQSGVVFPIAAGFHRDEQFCFVDVKVWHPYTCQGSPFERFRLQIHCSAGLDPEEVFWRRSSSHPSQLLNELPYTPLFSESNLSIGFGILMEIVVVRSGLTRFGIGSLGCAAAAKVLCEKLVANPEVCYLETATFGKTMGDHENQRQITLFQNLMQEQTLSEILLEDLSKFDQQQIDQFFESLENHHDVDEKPRVDEKSLKVLELPKNRYVCSWSRDSATNHNDSSHRISISRLVLSLVGTGSITTLQHLNLSGLPLEIEPVVALARQLRNIPSLQMLLLRNNGLDETAINELVSSGLADNKYLKQLDLSHNQFTMTCTESLCEALRNENTALERLSIEQCDIDIDQARVLAESLPDMMGILHLQLNGNPFLYDNGSPGHAGGAVMVLEALEQNVVLRSLEMGLPSLSRVCCTPPDYIENFEDRCTVEVIGEEGGALPPQPSRKAQLLERNKRLFHEAQFITMQQSIIKIVQLLLTKLPQTTNS